MQPTLVGHLLCASHGARHWDSQIIPSKFLQMSQFRHRDTWKQWIICALIPGCEEFWNAEDGRLKSKEDNLGLWLMVRGFVKEERKGYFRQKPTWVHRLGRKWVSFFWGKADKAWLLPPLSEMPPEGTYQVVKPTLVAPICLRLAYFFWQWTGLEGAIPAERVPSLGSRSQEAFLCKKEILHISD